MSEEYQSNQPEFDQSAEKPKHPVFCVTPVSRYLALALFVILPFLGGYIGYSYAVKDSEMKHQTSELLRQEQYPLTKPVETTAVIPTDISTTNPEPCPFDRTDYSVTGQQYAIGFWVRDGMVCFGNVKTTVDAATFEPIYLPAVDYLSAFGTTSEKTQRFAKDQDGFMLMVHQYLQPRLAITKCWGVNILESKILCMWNSVKG